MRSFAVRTPALTGCALLVLAFLFGRHGAAAAPATGATSAGVVLHAVSGMILPNGGYADGVTLPDGSRARIPQTGGPVWKAFYEIAARRTPVSLRLHLDTATNGTPHHVDYTMIVDYPIVRCDVRRGELAGTTQTSFNGAPPPAVSVTRIGETNPDPPILACADDTLLALAEHFDAAAPVVESRGPAIGGRASVVETVELPATTAKPAMRETLTLDAALATPLVHTIAVAGAPVRTIRYAAVVFEPALSFADALRGRDGPATPVPALTVAPATAAISQPDAPGAPLRPMVFPSAGPSPAFAMPGYTPRPFEIEPRPESLTQAEVIVEFGPGEPPDIGNDALLTGDEYPGREYVSERAIDVELRSASGTVVAKPTPDPHIGDGLGGTPPFETISYGFADPIAPAEGRYRLVASWHTHPAYSAYTEIEVAAVPPFRVGDRYVAPLVGRTRFTGPFYDLKSIAGGGDDATVTLVAESDPTLTHTQRARCENGCWPRVVETAETLGLSKRVANAHLTMKNADFTCFDARNVPGRGHLKDGKTLHAASIVRVAHDMQWLANDPRLVSYSYPCNGDCSKHLGVYVDSPLLVKLSFDPADVELLPQRYFGSPMRYAESCVGGLMILRDVAQFDDVFAISP